MSFSSIVGVTISKKEKNAVDNMTMFAGVGEHEALKCPNVVYLIKAKRTDTTRGDRPIVHEFDVYEVRAGHRITNLTLTYSVCQCRRRRGCNYQS
jgi:hypothetical protein